MCQKKTISNGEVWVKGEKYIPVGSFAQYNRMFLHFVIKSVLDRPELLMDVVKLKGRAQKVQVGDCVSVSGGYFGKPFQKNVIWHWFCGWKSIRASCGGARGDQSICFS